MPMTRGFTLIEVLVALVVLVTGLLGMAGLMTVSQRAMYESYQVQQALSLANDMAERIKNNQGVATSYLIPTPGVGASTVALGLDCGTATCTPAQLATYDIQTWTNTLNGNTETTTAGGANIGGIINARGCVQAVAGTPNTYLVSVAWQGNVGTVVPTSDCGKNAYSAENTRRLVSITVGVCTPNATNTGCR